MTYNLANDYDRQRFLTMAQGLADRGRFVELKDKTNRTTNQNSYLHLLIGAVAMETGNTLEDTKRWYFKEVCNADLFHRQHFDKMGTCIDSIRSTADLSKEEMSTAIDRFKRWAADNHIYLPEPGDDALLRDIAASMSRLENYL